jgi:protein-L-isoaspartate(D-aspartate) O-methyltransferase
VKSTRSNLLAELAASAKQRLDRLGFKNVQVRQGDGYLGWPQIAPFDSILVTAGATEVPQPLVSQLKPGGRMIIPVGGSSLDQVLKVVEKDVAGKSNYPRRDPRTLCSSTPAVARRLRPLRPCLDS